MKILVISHDHTLFDPTSVAHEEMLRASELVDEARIIVFTKEKNHFQFTKVSEKLSLYPTNSSSKFSYIKDALRTADKEMARDGVMFADIISAQNSFRAAVVAYLLSKKYRRNYTVDVYRSTLVNEDAGIFVRLYQEHILKRVFGMAKGIRVISQVRGERISRENSGFEKKIFILPFLEKHKSMSGISSEEKNDIRKKFPEFNLILATINADMTSSDLKVAKKIMEELRRRYPHIGIVIAASVRNAGWHPFLIHFLPEHIKLIKADIETVFSYQGVNVFLDFRDSEEESGELMHVLREGSPVIVSSTFSNANFIHEGENGFLADPKNPQTFARKVIDILEIPGLRESMHVYRYSISDLYGTDIDDYYERLVSIWETCRTGEDDMHYKVISQEEITRKKEAAVAKAKATEEERLVKERAEKEEEARKAALLAETRRAEEQTRKEASLAEAESRRAEDVSKEALMKAELEAEEEEARSVEAERVKEMEREAAERAQEEARRASLAAESRRAEELARREAEKTAAAASEMKPTAFTLDTVRKVFQRFETNKHKRRMYLEESEAEAVFDVDSVKLGMKEALAEIAIDENLEGPYMEEKEAIVIRR